MGYTILADKITFDATTGTGTLQDAINQAQTTQLPLFIKPGTYATGNLVISAPKVQISATPGTVTILSSSSVNGFNLDIRANAGGPSVADVTLRGIAFWGANLPFATAVDPAKRYVFGQFALAGMPAFNGIVTALNVVRLVVEDCQIGGSGSNGLALWGCTAEIRNNDFVGNFLNAIYVSDGWSSVIADNFIRDGKNAGIFVTRQAIAFDGTIIRGNRIHNTGATWNTTAGQVSSSGWLGNAIYAYQANNIVIDGNVCYNSTFSGVRLFDCWNFAATNNQIFQCGETALFCEAPVPPGAGVAGEANPNRFEGGVIANNVVVNAGNGVTVTNGWYGGRRVSITGNHVKTITRNTIATNDPAYPSYQTTASGIVAENDCVVSGNIVEECQSGAGIALMSQGFANGSTLKSTGNANGNTIKKSQIGIAFFKEASTGYSLITGNLIEGYTNGAIVPVTLSSPYFVYTRVAGSTDYGNLPGKPFANVVIGQNFAI